MRRLLLTFAALCAALGLLAQSDLAIGQWQAHLPHTNANAVTQTPEHIVFSTGFGLLLMRKADYEVQFWDKSDRLSDAGIRLLRYDAASGYLVVAYNNSNIDLIKDGQVRNLPAIKLSTSLPGDKRIYDIGFDGAGRAFLSCGFGLVALDLAAAQIAFSTFTGIRANSFALFGGHYYVGTDEGLYRVAQNTPNPADFSAWDFLGGAAGFDADYTCTHLLPYGGGLLMAINDSLYHYDGAGRAFLENEPGYAIRYLKAGLGKYLIGYRCLPDCKGIVRWADAQGNSQAAISQMVDRPNDAEEDSEGRIWFADGFDKLRMQRIADESYELFEFNAPRSVNTRKLTAHEGELWVATGGVTSGWNYLYRADGTYLYSNGDWEDYRLGKTPGFDGLSDHMQVAVRPSDGRVFIGCYGPGLAEFDRQSGAVTVFRDNNSAISAPAGDPSNYRVSALAFDAEETLWLCNHSAARPLVSYSAEGEWHDYALPFSEQLAVIAVDDFGNKWLASSASDGLFIFNEGADKNSSADDQVRLIRASNVAEMPSDRINVIRVDREGAVWVGTDRGAVVFECGNNVFDPSRCGPVRRIVAQTDTDNAYLLETENVRAIAVDGANRKWFGTENGIFVQSPNGVDPVARFTEANSPLFDDNITDIAINDTNGEVFIGTDRGLIAYRSDATAGGTRHADPVRVFPNPVRPDYEGPIAIQGLPRDADVKITDIGGTLIFEGTALGGQAIWDGRDYNGRKASSGVYLVFSSGGGTLGTPDAYVAKILFLK